ncbi:MAG: NAD(P)/FAD-dependent oxidoreductase [Flavitalea sp.]
MKDFDVIIIGSGVGGLITANLLAMQGCRVCVLEKNKQVGGALQVYVRNRVIFDTGVHYLGGLDKGQNLYKIFDYLGIMQGLKLKKMPEIFDRIIIEGDEKVYELHQGYENFIQGLLKDFPEEENGIRTYCAMMQNVCSKFPLYNLRSGGSFEEKSEVMDIDARTYIDSITSNQKLRDVLAGNNMLYAGQPEKTPFYVHALILNSYIESSWKCVDGGSQIAKLLVRNITRLGGVVKIHREVVKLTEQDGIVIAAELSDGSVMTADKFISNVHPVQTMKMVGNSVIRNSFRSRISSLENAVSSFTVDIILKKDCFPALDSNYYYHKSGAAWNGPSCPPENWPNVYAIFKPEYSEKFGGTSEKKDGDRQVQKYARSISLLTYMNFHEVAAWQDSFNTVSREKSRGEAYEAFKKEKAEKLIELVSEKFPYLRDCIDTYYTATPLSYRDYMGNSDGTMYGIVKDVADPLKTMISPKTRIQNLFLTGQNLNMHGILGVAMSALQTIVAITGSEAVIDDIREGNQPVPEKSPQTIS